ncbi:MAG: hypothetical protein JSW12_21855 [Deltaproteobacteria bacterium]|nr:MAG: hypothetical protein JSW12_21855 [Deltaproteobacteria bacterium]
MWAQVVLTPAESKKFIAKAIVEMDIVKRALSAGTIVIHPSSSTFFIVEEITGNEPDTDMWVLGLILPQGLCRAAGRKGKTPTLDHIKDLKTMMYNFPFKWVIKERKLYSGIPLGEILEELGPDDAYIKGCNALDIHGNAGVLYGHAGGGTIAYVLAAQKKKGFNVILPVGLEKLIPGTIVEAAKAARRKEYKYGMGMTCGLFPVRGKTITEIDAVKLLSGANATSIASGGLGGAEGGVVLSINGDKAQVTKVIEYIEQSKGARLPQARAVDCDDCHSPDCHFPAKEKHWG